MSEAGSEKGITAMNAINETAFAILGSSALISGATAFAIWGAIVALIGLI
jgi:hypothetical protein